MNIPNAITLARAALTIALYRPASTGNRDVLLWGFVVAFASDLLDGYLARSLNQTSYLGMRLDSMVDYLLTASAAIWLWWLEPTVFTDHLGLWVAIVLTLAAPQAIALIRFGRDAGFHLYSTKAAGWVASILFVHALTTGRHGEWLLTLLTVLVLVKNAEETLICLFVPDPHRDLRPSVLSYYRRSPK